MMKLSKTQMRRIFALLKDIGAVESRAVFVPQFCGGRTDHVSDLTPDEADAMIVGLGQYAKQCAVLNEFVHKKHNAPELATLQNTEGVRKYNADPSADKMRRKVLHYLGMMGYLRADRKFDYERINGFIEGIGTRNPTKAKFNFLTTEELKGIVTQVEQMYKKTLK